MMSTPMYNSWDNCYKSVFGALKRQQTCDFRIWLKKGTPCHELVFVIFRPGYKERFIPMQYLQNGLDVNSSEEYDIYGLSYSPQYVGIHYYYFTLLINGERHYIKRGGANIGCLDNGELFQLTVYDADFTTPDFIKGGVMYQIFPDRFCKSGEPAQDIPYGRILREDWGGVPQYRPDEQGKVRNNDYFGGNLQGILEKLPYLADLGVTCIYLNPIFEAHENHRYNTADYRKVDPLLGTNKDFQRLCQQALELYGIRVILDGVFSHTGADSVYFNKYNRYSSLGAYNSPNSPYYPWYTFYSYPDNYEAWWGINTLPNVRENNEEYTDFICGKDGVLEYWLHQGASGYRLDVADELPDLFLDRLRMTVKDMGHEHLVIGEVWEDASNKESYGARRRYLLGEQLDSVMNYPFKEAILDYVRCPDPPLFVNRIMTILENYPKPSVDTLMNFISTHDTERAITRLAGDPICANTKDWQATHVMTGEQYRTGVALLKCAMVLQFFLPGIPCIYYGDEAGMQGYRDPFNRGCYPWGAENAELVAFTKELAAIRASSDVFCAGRFTPLFASVDLFIFSRTDMSLCKSAIIFLNKSHCQQRLAVRSSITKDLAQFHYARATLENDGSELVIEPFDYAVILGTERNCIAE